MQRAQRIEPQIKSTTATTSNKTTTRVGTTTTTAVAITFSLQATLGLHVAVMIIAEKSAVEVQLTNCSCENRIERHKPKMKFKREISKANLITSLINRLSNTCLIHI